MFHQPTRADGNPQAFYSRLCCFAADARDRSEEKIDTSWGALLVIEMQICYMCDINMDAKSKLPKIS
jgi:hypothetical protein